MKNIFIILCAALSGLMFGWDQGSISGMLPFITAEYNLSSLEAEVVVSSMMFGAVLGAINGYLKLRKSGRVKTLKSACLFFILGAIAVPASIDVIGIIVWRFVLGFGVGMLSITAPMYIAEVSETKVRGRNIGLYHFMLTVGILTSFIVNTFFSYDGDWRSMALSLAVPGIILYGLLYKLPDSKYTSNKDSMKILFKNKKLKRVTTLGMALQMLQQLTGLNIIVYYAPKLMESAGFVTPVEQIQSTIILGVVFSAATLVATFIVDKVGRKSLLSVGSLMMATGMISLFLNQAQIFGLIMCLIGFAIGAGPVVWILCSEIQPTVTRELGTSLSTIVNWSGCILIGMTFLTLLENFGEYTFLIYAFFNLVFVAVNIFFVPETKGVPITTIEIKLHNGEKLRNLGC